MVVKLINDGTVNKNRVKIGLLTLYFSYQTIVAFESPEEGLVCCKNMWSKTTGKYLNEIEPDKGARVDDETFQRKLSDAFANLREG